jgi:hypothetical protein
VDILGYIYLYIIIVHDDMHVTHRCGRGHDVLTEGLRRPPFALMEAIHLACSFMPVTGYLKGGNPTSS